MCRSSEVRAVDGNVGGATLFYLQTDSVNIVVTATDFHMPTKMRVTCTCAIGIGTNGLRSASTPSSLIEAAIR